MSQFGQTIEIFLPDGNPSGIWAVSIMGKSILATVSPRNNLENLVTTRPEVQKQGIYILAGIDVETLRHIIYIGQSENVWQRLRQHNDDSSKDFWERTIIFTSNDSNFNKAHAQYLESRLINLANDSKRATIKNGNTPSPLGLSESHRAYMEEWLSWIKLLLPVLGYNFAVPVPVIVQENNVQQETSEIPEENITLKLKMNAVGVDARLYEINNEWIIIAGSTFRKETTDSFWNSLKALRNNMIADGLLVDNPDNRQYLKLTRNYPAKSLSSAAGLITGARYSGPATWILEETGEPYRQWSQRQLDEAETRSSDILDKQGQDEIF